MPKSCDNDSLASSSVHMVNAIPIRVEACDETVQATLEEQQLELSELKRELKLLSRLHENLGKLKKEGSSRALNSNSKTATTTKADKEQEQDSEVAQLKRELMQLKQHVHKQSQAAAAPIASELKRDEKLARVKREVEALKHRDAHQAQLARMEREQKEKLGKMERELAALKEQMVLCSQGSLSGASSISQSLYSTSGSHFSLILGGDGSERSHSARSSHGSTSTYQEHNYPSLLGDEEEEESMGDDDDEDLLGDTMDTTEDTDTCTNPIEDLLPSYWSEEDKLSASQRSQSARDRQRRPLPAHLQVPVSVPVAPEEEEEEVSPEEQEESQGSSPEEETEDSEEPEEEDSSESSLYIEDEASLDQTLSLLVQKNNSLLAEMEKEVANKADVGELDVNALQAIQEEMAIREERWGNGHYSATDLDTLVSDGLDLATLVSETPDDDDDHEILVSETLDDDDDHNNGMDATASSSNNSKESADDHDDDDDDDVSELGEDDHLMHPGDLEEEEEEDQEAKPSAEDEDKKDDSSSSGPSLIDTKPLGWKNGASLVPQEPVLSSKDLLLGDFGIKLSDDDKGSVSSEECLTPIDADDFWGDGDQDSNSKKEAPTKSDPKNSHLNLFKPSVVIDNMPSPDADAFFGTARAEMDHMSCHSRGSVKSRSSVKSRGSIASVASRSSLGRLASKVKSKVAARRKKKKKSTEEADDIDRMFQMAIQMERDDGSVGSALSFRSRQSLGHGKKKKKLGRSRSQTGLEQQLAKLGKQLDRTQSVTSLGYGKNKTPSKLRGASSTTEMDRAYQEPTGNQNATFPMKKQKKGKKAWAWLFGGKRRQDKSLRMSTSTDMTDQSMSSSCQDSSMRSISNHSQRPQGAELENMSKEELIQLLKSYRITEQDGGMEQIAEQQEAEEALVPTNSSRERTCNAAISQQNVHEKPAPLKSALRKSGSTSSLKNALQQSQGGWAKVSLSGTRRRSSFTRPVEV